MPRIVSYTTRPMGKGEADGREHWFVGKCDVLEEGRLAYTMFGEHEYWATLKQATDNTICTYVIDEKGLAELILKYGDVFDVSVITIDVEDAVLQKRGISYERRKRDRERIQLTANIHKERINNNGDLWSFFKEGDFALESILTNKNR